MSFLKRLTTLLVAILIILILFNIISIIETEAQDENKVTIQRNAIVWLYSTQRESERSVPYISLSLDKSSLNYHYINHIERFLRDFEAISRLNITLVFIGNERMYYQFTYKTPETTINIDSNIIIDEDYIVMQWFNSKIIIMNTSYVNVTRNPLMLPPQVIEIAKERYNLSISIGYLVYELKTNAGNIIEDLNIYDVSIKREMYVDYILSKFNSSHHKPYFNFTKIPMYAWIEVGITSFNDHEVVVIMLSGLGTDSINNALNILSYTIPMLDLVAGVIENLNLKTVYDIMSVEYRTNIVNRTMNAIQSYIVYNNKYTELINLLITKYNMVDPYIRVIVNQSLSRLRIQIMLQDRSTINIPEKDVKHLLVSIVDNLSLPSFINNINWSRIFDEVQVIDMRTSENTRAPNSSTLAINTLAVNTIVALTFVLTSLQTAIIIYIVLYVYRSIKRKLS